MSDPFCLKPEQFWPQESKSSHNWSPYVETRIGTKAKKEPLVTVFNKARLSRSIRIPRMHQVVAKVGYNRTCLLTIERNHKVLERHMIMMVHGIMDKVLKQTFQVWLSNFSNHAVKLFKKTVVGLASPVLGSIFTVRPQRSSRELHLKEGEGKTNRGKRETNHTGNLQNSTITEQNYSTTWRLDVTIGSEIHPLKGRIFDLLGLFSTMWSGHPGVIKATQHLIEVVPRAKLIHQKPYRASRKVLEVEIQEVERILKRKILEPAYAEWAGSVVMVKKRRHQSEVL